MMVKLIKIEIITSNKLTKYVYTLKSGSSSKELIQYFIKKTKSNINKLMTVDFFPLTDIDDLFPHISSMERLLLFSSDFFQRFGKNLEAGYKLCVKMQEKELDHYNQIFAEEFNSTLRNNGENDYDSKINQNEKSKQIFLNEDNTLITVKDAHKPSEKHKIDKVRTISKSLEVKINTNDSKSTQNLTKTNINTKSIKNNKICIKQQGPCSIDSKDIQKTMQNNEMLINKDISGAFEPYNISDNSKITEKQSMCNELHSNLGKLVSNNGSFESKKLKISKNLENHNKNNDHKDREPHSDNNLSKSIPQTKSNELKFKTEPSTKVFMVENKNDEQFLLHENIKKSTKPNSYLKNLLHNQGQCDLNVFKNNIDIQKIKMNECRPKNIKINQNKKAENKKNAKIDPLCRENISSNVAGKIEMSLNPDNINKKNKDDNKLTYKDDLLDKDTNNVENGEKLQKAMPKKDSITQNEDLNNIDYNNSTILESKNIYIPCGLDKQAYINYKHQHLDLEIKHDIPILIESNRYENAVQSNNELYDCVKGKIPKEYITNKDTLEETLKSKELRNIQIQNKENLFKDGNCSLPGFNIMSQKKNKKVFSHMKDFKEVKVLEKNIFEDDSTEST